MLLTIEESFLPATLTSGPMTDEQFAEFCAAYPDFMIEMTAEGDVVVMPPNYTLTGIRNGEIFGQLRDWAISDGRGIPSDPSTGFVLPSGARRSPDAAWTEKSRLATLDPASIERFWHLCPDFVIELKSHTDRLPVLRAKMREWIDNGAHLGWLIDVERKAVEIYHASGPAEVVVEASEVKGEGPVSGFTLELGRVWNPLK